MARVNSKKMLSFIPEVLLLLGGIFYFIMQLITTSSVSYLMIIGILIILALLIWKSKYLAIPLSVVLGFVSLFLMMALLAEFSEFPTGSSEGLQMLGIGISIFGSLLAISIIMPIKYFTIKE